MYGAAIKVRALSGIALIINHPRPYQAIIHEKFGDGICSMIDAKVTVERKPDPKGDRVILTFE